MGLSMCIHYAWIQLCLCAFSYQSALLWALICVSTMLVYSYAYAHLVTSLRSYGPYYVYTLCLDTVMLVRI